jgi:hypothetical protein
VLHDTENSVVRQVEIEQITAQFQLGYRGLPNEVKPHFRQGLQHLLQQQQAYLTAWLIMIVAARARTERRNAERNETYSRD